HDGVTVLAGGFHQGQMAFVQIAHRGHKSDAQLTAQLISELLNGMDDLHGRLTFLREWRETGNRVFIAGPRRHVVWSVGALVYWVAAALYAKRTYIGA